METPLITAAFWAMDIRERTYNSEHHLVCRILLDHNANPHLYEEDDKTALHKACWNCDHVLIQMLLEAGAKTNAMDVNGCAALQYLLKVTQIRPWAIPERCYQLLLNYGAARVYPPQFHKVQHSLKLLYSSIFIRVKMSVVLLWFTRMFMGLKILMLSFD